MMKKSLIAILIIAVIILSAVLVACGNTDETGAVNIYVPDGATTLALAKMMQDGYKIDGRELNINIVSGATEVAQKISQGGADIAILPANSAAKLYSQNVGLQLLAGNTFGNLYIVGKEPLTSINQLRGKTLYSIGEGAIPEFITKYVLEQNGIHEEDNGITYEYRAAASDIIPLLKKGNASFAVLAEPAASMAVAGADVSILFDLQAEWKKHTGKDGYPQAVTVARANFINQNKSFIAAFLTELQASIAFLDENYTKVNTILSAAGSTVTFGSDAIITRCNVRYQTAQEIKESLLLYLESMKVFNPNLLGEKLPGNAFFYEA